MVVALLALYYATPLAFALFSFGAACPYSPFPTHLCSSAGVDWYVKDYEGGDVDVQSCHKVGGAITNDEETGATLDEAWKCAVKQLDGTAGFVDGCYAVRNNLVKSISRRIGCASVGQGCPLKQGRQGGRGDREGRAVFLGLARSPFLLLEELRGNDSAYNTVRVDVFFQETEGAPRELCGYLNVRVPIASDVEDPTYYTLERNGWTASHYSLSYS